MKGFINFIRKQGVVGLAIGFLLGGAVSSLVNSLVNDIINPLLGLLLGPAEVFTSLTLSIGSASVKVGSFISAMIDFGIVAATVYFVFKGLGLENLDKDKK